MGAKANSSDVMVRQIVFARAAVTKYHRTGGLHNRNLFSHSSGGQKSKIRVSVGLVSSETSL